MLTINIKNAKIILNNDGYVDKEGIKCMGKYFEKEISILTNDTPLGKEMHLCECGYEECRPTKAYEFMPIDYWVIHYCVAGEGEFRIRDQQNHIREGDIFMIPPHTENRYAPSIENPWCYCWVGFRGELMGKVLERCGLTPEQCVLHYRKDVRLEELFARIYDSFQKGRELKALGDALGLLDYMEHYVNSGEEESVSPGEQYFLSLRSYINRHYREDITVSQMAEAVNIDRTYVYKLFRRFSGKSPSQYLQQYRLEQAAVLLRKSSLSITEICYETGYQHLPYFTKMFREYREMTPSEYRKRFIKKTFR